MRLCKELHMYSGMDTKETSGAEPEFRCAQHGSVLTINRDLQSKSLVYGGSTWTRTRDKSVMSRLL